MIYFQKINESKIKLITSFDIKNELYDKFSFDIPNSRFMKKSVFWDGKHHMIDYYTGLFDYGLLPVICDYLNNEKYEYQIDPKITNFKEYPEFNPPGKINDLITPYDYQIDHVIHCLKNKKTIIVSPTGSGKSLTIYMVIDFILKQKDYPILIITPKIDLVRQLYQDFIDYNPSFENKIQCIYQGQDKKITKPIVISTWQSIYNLSKKYFGNFKTVIADEVHSYSANQICKPIENSINAVNKIGFTGTLQDTELDILKLTGLFGTPYTTVTTTELIENKKLSPIKIKCILLQHSKKYNNKSYKDEVDFLISHNKRNEFITQLSLKLKGNTLILLDRVDDHALPLYHKIKQFNSENTFLITGKIPIKEREVIKNHIRENNTSILVATFGTFQMGINIKNINNIIFAYNGKSTIRILQSIGRGLRKYKNKILTVYDIGDSLEYSFNHFNSRLELYSNQEFPIISYKYNL